MGPKNDYKQILKSVEGACLYPSEDVKWFKIKETSELVRAKQCSEALIMDMKMMATVILYFQIETFRLSSDQCTAKDRDLPNNKSELS